VSISVELITCNLGICGIMYYDTVPDGWVCTIPDGCRRGFSVVIFMFYGDFSTQSLHNLAVLHYSLRLLLLLLHVFALSM
jgi:hypothetical protein